MIMRYTLAQQVGVGDYVKWNLAGTAVRCSEKDAMGAALEVGSVGSQILVWVGSVSPLLQCVYCHNTESPAGAMARTFNHGLCLHCGGTFKVVRA